MKLLSTAIAGAVALASRTHAVVGRHARSLGRSDVDGTLRSGRFVAERLWKDAVPARRRRRTEQNGAGYYNQYYYERGQTASSAFQISGNYTLRFASCLTLAVADQTLLSDDYLPYAQDGTVRAEQSFVLFSVCRSEDCHYDPDDESTNFLVPIETFVMSLLRYEPNRRSEYCQACTQEYSYCKTGEGMNYDDEDPDDPTFFYYHGTRYELINCHRCEDYNCYGGNGNYDAQSQQYTAENDDFWYYMNEWMEQIAGCSAIGYAYWNDLDLYAGMVCNAEGDGFDVGVFVDESCTLRNTQTSYTKSISDQQEYMYYYKSKEITDYVFNGDVDCNGEYIEYVNAYQPVYEQDFSYADSACEKDDDGNYKNQYLCQQYQKQYEMETNPERRANQACKSLFGSYGYSYAMSMEACESQNHAAAGYQSGSNRNNRKKQQQLSELEQQWIQSGLYDYDLTSEQIMNMNRVCEKVADGYEVGRYATGRGSKYNSDGSRKSIWSGASTGGVIAAIAFFAVVAAVSAAGLLHLRRFIENRERKRASGDTDVPPPKNIPLMT